MCRVWPVGCARTQLGRRPCYGQPCATGSWTAPNSAANILWDDTYFYCHEALLVIELGGGVHDDASQVEYDLVRQKEIEERGLTVLRIKNDEVIESLSATLDKIADVLNKQ